MSDIADLVVRLRRIGYGVDHELRLEAANEIEALRIDLENVRGICMRLDAAIKNREERAYLAFEKDVAARNLFPRNPSE